jgi:Bacteriocin-protection, YdeI or OmpD-Associated/Domain of unknown function (DUF1905)
VPGRSSTRVSSKRWSRFTSADRVGAVRRFEAVLEPFGQAAAITLPFDPKAEWGKVRAPVRGTIEGYPFTTTVARYGGVDYLAFRREVREAAAVEVGARVTIEVELDTSERVVEVPGDLATALAGARMRETFDGLSYTHRKEYVSWIEEARREETRRTRVVRAVDMLKEGVRTPK